MSDTPKTESLKDDMVDGWPDRWLASHADLERELAAAIAQRDKLEKALESIGEYWNQDRNDSAMFNACWYAIDTAEKALKECGK